LTNAAVPSARLYWESKLAFFAPKGVPDPAAVSAYLFRDLQIIDVPVLVIHGEDDQIVAYAVGAAGRSSF